MKPQLKTPTLASFPTSKNSKSLPTRNAGSPKRVGVSKHSGQLLTPLTVNEKLYLQQTIPSIVITRHSRSSSLGTASALPDRIPRTAFPSKRSVSLSNLPCDNPLDTIAATMAGVKLEEKPLWHQGVFDDNILDTFAAFSFLKHSRN
ncbi:hypothetical protein HDV03_002869 [Kappamyces sp. JEL0829]|nr:hypothetical protein HDV03_002869 [Kappamyces sp. JEL0829]